MGGSVQHDINVLFYTAKPSKPTSKDRIPIIIVPAAPTAKFTLFNIKQFLENFE